MLPMPTLSKIIKLLKIHDAKVLVQLKNEVIRNTEFLERTTLYSTCKISLHNMPATVSTKEQPCNIQWGQFGSITKVSTKFE